MIKQLLEAGVHFGHQTKRWHPKMKRFIFGQRNGIYIIDLEKTVEHLNQARDFVYEVASTGGHILFVGTKKQAQEAVEEAAKKSGMSFVKNRWLGGLLTNFQTVKKSVERLRTIEKMNENGIFAQLTKKEVARLTKEKDKILRNLGGIRDMTGLPQAVFLIDSKKEDIAVEEAHRLKIPVVALIDTNCDPELIDYPIPGNDDALKSIRFLTSLITESIMEGRRRYLTGESETAPASLPQSQAPREEEPLPVAVAAEPALPAGKLQETLEELESLEETTEKEKEERKKLVKPKIHREAE